MARLDNKPYPGDWDMRDDESFDDWVARGEVMLREICSKQPRHDAKDLTGAIVRFPAPDGSALYVVSKDKPLTLQHVPVCDAYRADYRMIRGTTRSDVREELKYNGDL